MFDNCNLHAFNSTQEWTYNLSRNWVWNCHETARQENSTMKNSKYNMIWNWTELNMKNKIFIPSQGFGIATTDNAHRRGNTYAGQITWWRELSTFTDIRLKTFLRDPVSNKTHDCM